MSNIKVGRRVDIAMIGEDPGGFVEKVDCGWWM